MAVYTFDGSTCLQSVIDQIRNNPDPGGDTINFDASAFPTGGPIMPSDNPCGRGGETPPTWDGSNCTGYGGAVANLDGIRNLTINGNGVRITSGPNSNWTLGIHDTQNVTINDLIIRGDNLNDAPPDANGVIFGTAQSGSWTDSNGQQVGFTNQGNYNITLNNVVTEAGPNMLGGIQSFNSSDGWFIYDSRFTSIPGRPPAGAYTTNGPSQISFFGAGQRSGGGPNRFEICDVELDNLEQWGNSTGINSFVITDGNALIWETGTYDGDVYLNNIYAHDVSADILNTFRQDQTTFHMCNMTAHDYGYYVRQSSGDNFSPPPRNGTGVFAQNNVFGFGSQQGSPMLICNVVSDRGGDGANTFIPIASGGGTISNTYLLGGYAQWGALGAGGGSSVFNGAAIPGGFTAPSDDTLCTTSSCPGCTGNPCSSGADICGRPFECGEMGAFSTSDVVIEECVPFAFNPATGSRTLCAGEPGTVTVNVVPVSQQLVWSATGPAGWVITAGPTTTIVAPAVGTGTVVITGECEGDTQTFTVDVTVIDCTDPTNECAPSNLGDICNDRPTSFGIAAGCTILGSDGPAIPIVSGNNIVINPTGELGEFFVTYQCVIDGETVACFGTATIVECATTQDCVLKGCVG